MKSVLAALLLLTVAAPCIAADYTVEIKGTLYAMGDQGRQNPANVKVSVEADTLWGHKTSDELERTKKKTGQDYPEFTATGSGTTDDKGFFQFDVDITVPDGKKLPRSSDGNNPPSWYAYVAVKLKVELEGYRQPDYGTILYIDKENSGRSISLQRIGRITGRLMSLENMKPLANTVVVIRQKFLYGRQDQEVPSWTVTTDANGKFDLNDPEGPLGMVRLDLEDESLAFATNSKGWTDIPIQTGDNDLGNLMVVAGCSLKLRVVDSIEKKPVSIVVALYAQGTSLFSEPVPTGEFEKSGIPEGTYLVDIVTGAYFGRKLQNVKLAAGENDLGDILVEPMLNLSIAMDVESGKVPANASASAILIEGTPPETNREWGNTIKFRGSVNGPRGIITGLFRGRWYVQVRAEGWAPFWTEVTLPMEGDLKVTLGQGGSFEATITDPEGKSVRIEWVGVAVQGSDAEPWLQKLQGELDRHSNQNPPGLLYSQGSVLAANPNAPVSWNPGPLLPGKYYLRARTMIGFVETEFEIVAGKHLELTLAPEPGRIEVTVTKDGQPAPGETVLFARYQFGSDIGEVTEGRTDSSGVYVFEVKQPASYLVLLKREKEWIDAGSGRYEQNERKKSFSDRSFHVKFGSVVQVNIDAGGRERTWLTVELDLEDGYSVRSASLVPKLQRSQNIGAHVTGSVEGDKVSFGMLRPGNYLLVLSMKDESNRMFSTVSELRAEPKPEQSVDVEVELHEVTVTAKFPSGALEDSASVIIMSKPDAPYNARFSAGAAERKRNKFTFPSVPPGEYDVVVTVPKEDGRYTWYGSESISVDGRTKAKVTVDDDQGSLQVNIRGGASGMLPGSMQKMTRVILIDSGGKPVMPGMPSSAATTSTSLTVRGVPSGKYTVRVESTGCSVWEGEVEIEEEQTARLNVALESAAIARIEVSPGCTPLLLAEEFTLKLEDANGEQVPEGGVDARDLFLEVNDFGQHTLYITRLDSSVKRMRIKLKGYQEVVFDVNVASGATFDQKLDPEPE